MLGDIQNPKWLYFKGFLMLTAGMLASTLLLVDDPRWRTAALLGIAVWGFCRAYYFAFYVIEHYIDPAYRFAGLIAFGRYALSGKQKIAAKRPPDHSRTQEQ